MSFSQLDRITLAAKALAGGVLDADPVAQWYESVLPFSFALPSNKVWTQADEVKAVPAPTLAVAQANAAGSLNGIISDLSAPASSIRLTPVPGVNNTYVALTSYGDFSSPLLDNWVAPVFAPQTNGLPSFGYAVRLYDGNPALGGTEVLTTDGTTGTGVNKSVAWMFNYAGGILLTSSDFSVADPYITGFRYIGDVAGTAPTGSSLRSYGEVNIAFPGASYPASGFQLTLTASQGKGNVVLVNDFDTKYYRSMVSLKVYDSSDNVIAEAEQTFPSLASIATWVNANVPNNGVVFSSSCIMEVHDIIDGSIRPPAKVYGKNRLYAGLSVEAPRSYYHRSQTASAFYTFNKLNKLQFATILNAIWTMLYGATMPPVASWTAQEFGCFWLGRNRRRRYAMPGFVAGSLTTTNNQQRYTRDIVTLTTGFPSANTKFTDTTAANVVAYGELSPTAIGSSTAFTALEAFSLLAPKIMSGASIIAGYPLRSSVPNEKAVYIKPVGMDQFFLDAYDDTLYQLEAVGTAGTRRHPRLEPLLSVSGGSRQNNSAGPVDGSDIGPAMGYTHNAEVMGIPGRHSFRIGEARFQYRDLATGRVSPVSTAAVKTIWRRRAIPYGLIVRNRVDV